MSRSISYSLFATVLLIALVVGALAMSRSARLASTGQQKAAALSNGGATQVALPVTGLDQASGSGVAVDQAESKARVTAETADLCRSLVAAAMYHSQGWRRVPC